MTPLSHELSDTPYSLHGFFILSPNQGPRVEARLGQGAGLWNNPGRLPKGGSKAGKRKNPRSVKVL